MILPEACCENVGLQNLGKRHMGAVKLREYREEQPIGLWHTVQSFHFGNLPSDELNRNTTDGIEQRNVRHRLSRREETFPTRTDIDKARLQLDFCISSNCTGFTCWIGTMYRLVINLQSQQRANKQQMITKAKKVRCNLKISSPELVFERTIE